MSELETVIEVLDGFSDPHDESQLAQLQEVIDRAAELPDPLLAVPHLLSVYERFPNDDGYGVFWSILHTIEAINGYELPLLRSVRKRPSEFSLLMINRILNVGVVDIEGVPLLPLLVQISTDARVPEAQRLTAGAFAAHQAGAV